MSTYTATGEDVIAAAHRDRLARTRERPATDHEMRDLPADAVRFAFPRLTVDERADLTSEVRLVLARRHGWNPPLSALDRPLLARTASALYRDNRQRWADVKDASAATDAEEGNAADAATRTDAAACWGGERLPAAAADWREVCDGLAVAHDSPEGVAIYAALSGYGTGAALATALGITEATARKRLQRGRERLARRFKNPDALADALADADLADRALADAPVLADSRPRPVITYRLDSGRVVTYPGTGMLSRLAPTNPTPVAAPRVRLDGERRMWRKLLDRLASTATLPHVTAIDPEPRLAALATVPGPVAVRRWQPERVALATRRDYRPNGRNMDSAPTRRPLADRIAATGRNPDPDAAWIAANTTRPDRPTFQRTPEAVWEARALKLAEPGRARLAMRWHADRAVSRLGEATHI